MNSRLRSCFMVFALGALLSTSARSQGRSSDSLKAVEHPWPADSLTSSSLARRTVGYLLPLAPDTLGLARPRFQTIRFCVGLGILWSDLSNLRQFAGNPSDVGMPITVAIRIPLTERPMIEFFGGWSFAIGGIGEGSMTTFSSVLLVRPFGMVPFGPIVGGGGGSLSYKTDGNVVINVSQSYPLLVAGLAIAPNTLDLLVTYPLGKAMNTTFSNETFTIRPAGMTASILLSL